MDFIADIVIFLFILIVILGGIFTGLIITIAFIGFELWAIIYKIIKSYQKNIIMKIISTPYSHCKGKGLLKTTWDKE